MVQVKKIHPSVLYLFSLRCWQGGGLLGRGMVTLVTNSAYCRASRWDRQAVLLSVTRMQNRGRTWNWPPFRAFDVESCWCALSTGPMKEEDLRPGTVFPVLGTLLFFLPERYKEKLCCVTPLASEVSYPSLCACVFSSLGVNRFSTPSAQRHQRQALPNWQEGQGFYQWGWEWWGRNRNQDCSFLVPDSASCGSGDRPVSPPLTQTVCAAHGRWDQSASGAQGLSFGLKSGTWLKNWILTLKSTCSLAVASFLMKQSSEVQTVEITGLIYEQYAQQKATRTAIFRQGWYLSIWTWVFNPF